MVRQTVRNRWRSFQRAMLPAVIVVENRQTDHRFVILPLL